MKNSNVIQQTQVVIIGAGPTGLSLAAQLHRYDIDFIILDKNKATTTFSKALLVHAHTLEILQELDLAEEAIEKGQITQGLNLLTNGKQKARINIAELGKGQSQFPFILSLEQSKTEKLLHDHLQKNQVNVQWECAFTSFEQNENTITAFYTNSDGEQHTIHANYLVGCDGAGSLVRHQMGAGFEGNTASQLFYVADVYLKCAVIDKKEFYFFLNKSGFVLFFSIEGEERYRIVGIVPDEIQNANTTIEFNAIQEHIKQQVVVPIEFTGLKWFSTYKIHSRRANKFAETNVFIAGDAAHIHTPVGGQGMNTGIQDAYNLAWKLSFAIKQNNKDVLKTYAQEREQNATHLLQSTDRMFDIMAGHKGFAVFFRLHLLPVIANIAPRTLFGKKKIFPFVSQIGIVYFANYLVIKSAVGNVKAGGRMPYFIIEKGQSIFELLNKPVFKILYFGDKKNNAVYKNNITLETFDLQNIPSLFGDHSDFYLLLRPDNYISYIGKNNSKIISLLDTLTK